MSKRSQRVSLGYTLIEIMVVLAMISIVLGLTVANFQTDERQLLKQEARRLALLLSHASTRTSSLGKPIAWRADSGRYTFFQYNIEKNDWGLIENDSPLRVRYLPEQVAIKKLTIAGQLAQKNEMIVFSTSGVNMAFSITLSLEHASINVEGDSLGNVTVSEVKE